MLHEKMKVKYVGFKLDKNEGKHQIFTIHTIQFMRESRRKYYHVAVTAEFDPTISLDDDDESHYDFWEFCQDT